MTLADDTPLSPALGIGAFAEKTLVAAGQCVTAPRVSPAAGGLIGCGVNGRLRRRGSAMSRTPGNLIIVAAGAAVRTSGSAETLNMTSVSQ